MRPCTIRPPHVARALLGSALLTLAAACSHDAIAPAPPSGPPAPAFHPALIRVTLSGLGSGQMHASARMAAPPAATALGSPAIRANLVGPANSGGTGDGTIQLEPLSTGSFTQGARGSDGVRYFWATFRVRNAQSDSTPYDTPRQNLTFFATATDSTLGGSAIASLGRFDSTAADPAIAPEIVPTDAVDQALAGSVVSRSPDVLQVLTADEAAAVAAPAGVTVLPYGFVVHNATDDGRSLPASPAAGQYDGVVTFAFKVPLQASPADDPFTISAMFLAEDDGETRITESLEEQTATGEAAFFARAAAIGATMKTLLPGMSSYLWGDASNTRTVCTVPITTATAPTPGYLVHRAIESITLTDSRSAWPLWAGGSVAREFAVVVRDSGGSTLNDVPVQLAAGTSGVLATWGSTGTRLVPRWDRASTDVAASACGQTSTAVTLRASGYSPIAGGISHSLALKADGTVVGWGDPGDGELNIPAGLTNVVQVAAGYYFSLALESNGTVVAWGDSTRGQLNVPTGLTDVVQISARGYHSVALKADGTVVAWGTNGAGELNIPVGLTNVVQVAAGALHSLALKADGTVVAWGSNDSGQLNIPDGLANVVQVAAGYDYSLALKADGTVVAWGNKNTYGQLNVPADLTGVVQIVTGVIHSLALKADGTVVAWGSNDAGELNVPAGLVAAVP